MKRVLILGMDGYIGWALANELADKGYYVYGADNFWRRDVAESLVPIPLRERVNKLPICTCWLQSNPTVLHDLLSQSPDAIVHLAEQPSAPYSMTHDGAIYTQRNNVLGTLNLLFLMKKHCPEAHLIKLGTMGEYGTPDCTIPEGTIPSSCPDTKYLSCPMQGLMFPRAGNSFYHLSKVFDSFNIKFACDTWGLRATDIMQGIVFGLAHGTRFDYDDEFGTVVNRFCAQALAEVPLTVYGSGEQTRGFLPLTDSIKCIQLAIDNPPVMGEYRTFNQLASLMSVNDCAELITETARDLGITTETDHISNPRTEREHHLYTVEVDNLQRLGYSPNLDFGKVIYDTLATLLPFKSSINKDLIYPHIFWRHPYVR